MSSVMPDERMSDLDAVVWAIEREPRLRTTIAALAVVDGAPERQQVRHRVERAARLVPRLRQRVVHDPLDIAPPRWSLDPEFRLSHHFRVVRVGGGGTQRELCDLVQELIVQPFDRSRPLWEFTLIEGLAGGRTGLLLKSHHAVTDGVGGMELMLELFDLQPEPSENRDQLPPVPTGDHHITGVSEVLRTETLRLVGDARRALEHVAAPQPGHDLADRARSVGATISSLTRSLRPVPESSSALMKNRSEQLEVYSFAFDLDDLRVAGRRIGGSINDAFVAAVALGTADHHLVNGVPLERLCVSIPVNTRAGDTGVGNHWAPGRIELETSDSDPDSMMLLVRAAVTALRNEPSQSFIEPLAGLVRRLPDALTAGILDAVIGGIDIAASNVPGSPIPLHLCGHEVTELIPFGPLSGCAANVTIISHAGTAHVGVVIDPAAIADGDGYVQQLQAAFNSVLKGS